MDQTDLAAFTVLFRDVHLKCFGQELDGPLTETESKLLCNKILELTGLSIGWKSVKNYSLFIAGKTNGRIENPSVATMDTLARYVLGAPYCSEIDRKNNESHYPWWFLYKEKLCIAEIKPFTPRWNKTLILFALAITCLIALVLWMAHIDRTEQSAFSDNFSDVSDISLVSRGWFIKNEDISYWKKRWAKPGGLTLYTLKGDNWPDPNNKQGIKNLLLRPVPFECFTAEVHLSNFIPQQEWQQAGVILMEDTTLTGKSIRLSIAFNDYFGGYAKPNEILVQAITSLGNGFSKPEEIAHQTIAHTDTIKNNPVQLKMLRNSALRIEKQGRRFRFLYSEGISDNGAFKEVASQEFNMQPRYIGIFAIKGFKDSSSVIPARFTYFKIAGNSCQ